jgi:hypothetical protein
MLQIVGLTLNLVGDHSNREKGRKEKDVFG